MNFWEELPENHDRLPSVENEIASMEKQNEIRVFEDKKVRTLWDEEQEKPASIAAATSRR